MMDDRDGRAGGAGAAHVEPLLDRYRTGELEELERERVAAHLAECPECAAVLADSEAFAATVGRGYLAERAMQAADEPDWARQRAAIVARTSARSARRARAVGWPSWTPQAALAVLALIAVGVVYEVGVRGPGDVERVLSPGSPPAAAGSRPAEGGGVQGRDELSVVAGSQEKPAPAAAARVDAEEGVRSETEAAAAKTAGPPAAPAANAPAIEADLDESEGANRQAADRQVADRQGAGRREAEARPITGEQAADAAAPAALEAPPEDVSRSRFEDRARRALADRDTLAAEEALTVWRDSLASGAGLDPAQKRLAQALADSLAAFLASRP